MVPGLSAYMASKLAQTKLIEYLAAENPSIFAATVHPGMVETRIFTRSGAKAESLPMDKGAMSQFLNRYSPPAYIPSTRATFLPHSDADGP